MDNRLELIDDGAEVEESEMPVSVDGLRNLDSCNSDRKPEPAIRLSDGHDSMVGMPLTYSEYRFMTYSDKAKAFGIEEETPVNNVANIIKDFYDNCGHGYDYDDLMHEVDMIFKTARWDSIHETAEGTE